MTARDAKHLTAAELDAQFSTDWQNAASSFYIDKVPPVHRPYMWAVALARLLWDAGRKRGADEAP